MKKILVVLLVLAVSTGVFAQGSWSIGGDVEIGVRIDLNPAAGLDPQPADPVVALAEGSAYHSWDGNHGQFSAGYSNGPLFFGLGFAYDTAAASRATFSARGDNYAFKTQMNIFPFLTDTGRVFRRLWGEYNLLNGMVGLMVAYMADDSEYWVSDTTGVLSNAVGKYGYDNEAYDHAFFGDGSTFTYNEGGNFLKASFALAGLDFGIMLPNIFLDNKGFGWIAEWQDQHKAGGINDSVRDDVYNPPAPNAWSPEPYTTRFVDDILKMMIFGVRFDMAPIEFAAQFLMHDYGIYFGGKFYAGPIIAGLSFMGILGNPDDVNMAVGASINFDGGSFGAGLKGRLENWKDKTSDDGGTIVAVVPSFYINAIPSHLRFALDAGFYFETPVIAGEKDPMEVTWAVGPQLFWNFLGTGAPGGYTWGGTEMIARYRVVSDAANFFDLIFKFAY